VLDFLAAGVDLAVTLDRPSGVYDPGETVRATVHLESDRDLEVREASVALVGREEYHYSYTANNADLETEYRSAKGGERWEIDRRSLVRDGILAAGVGPVLQFEATLPEDALPTVRGGKLVRIGWAMEVSLDRPLARDVHAEAEVRVPVRLQNRLERAREYGRSSHPEEVELALSLPFREWVAGETMEGTLLVRPQQAFPVRGIHLELVRHEQVTCGEGNERRDRTRLPLAGRLELEAGSALAYPFQVEIPAEAAPSLVTPNYTIRWYLRGIVDRGLQAERVVEEEILVFTGR